MFVHAVFFWLKEDLSEADRQAFANGLEKLKEINLVKTAVTGKPVPSERPVVDGSYDYGLLCVFQNKRDEQTYQSHPIHQKFIETCKPYWEKIVVYDFQ